MLHVQPVQMNYFLFKWIMVTRYLFQVDYPTFGINTNTLLYIIIFFENLSVNA